MRVRVRERGGEDERVRVAVGSGEGEGVRGGHPDHSSELSRNLPPLRARCREAVEQEGGRREERLGEERERACYSRGLEAHRRYVLVDICELGDPGATTQWKGEPPIGTRSCFSSLASPLEPPFKSSAQM